MVDSLRGGVWSGRSETPAELPNIPYFGYLLVQVQVWLLPVGKGQQGEGGVRSWWAVQARWEVKVKVKKHLVNRLPGDLRHLSLEEAEEAGLQGEK